jgi:hypothetical protein
MGRVAKSTIRVRERGQAYGAYNAEPIMQELRRSRGQDCGANNARAETIERTRLLSPTTSKKTCKYCTLFPTGF